MSTTVARRFWAKVAPAEPRECWIWTAWTGHGYGRFAVTKRHGVQAHRWAYEQLVGPIPDGLHLDHLCRNRLCVNPLHLEPVTPGENVLRGHTVNARNARKAACLRGHPFDEANTAYTPEGHRMCRACKRTRGQRTYWRNKQEHRSAEAAGGARGDAPSLLAGSPSPSPSGDLA